MNPLVIFGASTRAAAFSAIRAGFDPICGDMFADADLRAWASVIDLPHYPSGLAKAVGHLSPMPLIYTGALENSPTELDRLSQRHILWGNASSSLRRCRDPWLCRDVLRRAGLPALDLCRSDSHPPRNEQWMLKPLRSAAGRAITVWSEDTKPIPEPHYFQQTAQGIPLAAAFLAGGDSVELLGISRQLIGQVELHAPEFGYCGSIFPWDGTSELKDMICQMGTVLATQFGLRGLFGIDLIHDGQNAWLTEVNPRYTASMELIEYNHREPLIERHRRAVDGMNGERPRKPIPTTGDGYCGKVILYADRPARAPDLSSRIPRSISLTTLPDLADIPVTGTEIQTGQPVFTCLGEGTDPDKLFMELIRRATELWSSF